MCLCLFVRKFLILHDDWAHCQKPHWILDLSHDPASPATIYCHFTGSSDADVYVFSDDRPTCEKVGLQVQNFPFLSVNRRRLFYKGARRQHTVLLLQISFSIGENKMYSSLR
jgi:hypothetical protein